MSIEQKCPKCDSENTYEDGSSWVCLECLNEWQPVESSEAEAGEPQIAKVVDANGNILSNGDSVTTIKDLKVKGSASGIKAGTKVKNIVLCEAHDGHDISCKVDGIGAMYLKSEFVKKA